MLHYTERPNGRNSLSAELSGLSCTALGITAHGTAPVLELCRLLIKAGCDPDTTLLVYRHGTLALIVRSLREAAKLTVKEPDRGRPHFAPWRPFDPVCVAPPASPVASPIAATDGAAL